MVMAYFSSKNPNKTFSTQLTIGISLIFGVFFQSLLNFSSYEISGSSIPITLMILIYRKREKTSKKKIKKSASISEDVAEAMASKIIFEAQQHRKVREDVNHLNIGSSKEE